MAKLVLSVNLLNAAVSQYSQYEYESACTTANKQVLGANENGIFMLEEPEHDEVSIPWHFVLPSADFGLSNQKRLRKVNVGGKAEDDLIFSFSPDGEAEHDVEVVMDKIDLAQSSGRGNGRRDKFGRYWGVKVHSEEHVDFSIDSIELEMVILGQKTKRR
jgi:hypothetical protein